MGSEDDEYKVYMVPFFYRSSRDLTEDGYLEMPKAMVEKFCIKDYTRNRSPFYRFNRTEYIVRKFVLELVQSIP